MKLIWCVLFISIFIYIQLDPISIDWQEQVVTALARASRPQELNPLIRYSAPEDICTRDDQQCKKKGWLIISPSARRPPLMDQHRTNHTVVGCNEVNGTERRKDASVTSSSEEEEEEEEEEELVVAMKHKQSVCHDGDFAGSRSKCARLIDACTEGIILRMTNQQFSHFRGNLKFLNFWIFFKFFSVFYFCLILIFLKLIYNFWIFLMFF